MNDLDLVRTMRADAPIPSQQRLDTGREQLLAAIGSPSAARRTVRAGRRFAGPRGILVAGGAAAAVAAGVAVATQVGGPPVTLHSAPAAESAKYADPLVETAAFGWLPGGLHADGYVADHQQEGYFEVTAQAGKGSSVTLTAYERGKEPFLGYLPGGIPAKRIPAAPVNGHRAYWIFKPDPSGQSSFELRWQYAPNSWADLTGNGLPGDSAELTRTARKIAATASFGSSRPIAMPLHIGGVPGGLSPDRTVLNNDAFGEVSAIVGYDAGGPSSNLGIAITKSDGTVPGKPGTPAKGRVRPNTKLGGYPAYQARGFVYVYGVNGFNVQINASGSVLAKLNATGGLAALFRKMTVLGTDQANWTTNPVN